MAIGSVSYGRGRFPAAFPYGPPGRQQQIALHQTANAIRGIFDKMAEARAKSAEAERSTLDKWILEKYDDPIYRFNDGSSYDPTSQSEAVGDDPVKASEYGIATLRSLPRI